jgi:hypothetical protein
MRTFRRLLIATVAIAVVLAAAPAFAQTAPATTQPAPPAPVQKQQGLGVFLQGGYIRSSSYGSGGTVDLNLDPQGVIFGIGFGGNKSGAFGIGADINYVMKSAADIEPFDVTIPTGTLKTQYLNIPVYGRFNIGGHNTKNAPTFYIPAGWFFDILLTSKLDSLDVKSKFDGFQTGPLVGAGFEVARIGIEFRGQWAITELASTGGGTFLNGMTDAKVFTWVALFKVRLN